MSKKTLSELVKYIKNYLAQRYLRLDRVILFGSHAQGRARPDSDVDIAIVSNGFNGKNIFQRARMMRGLHIGLTRRFSKPFDIVYLSTEELSSQNSFLLDYVRRGQEISSKSA